MSSILGSLIARSKKSDSKKKAKSQQPTPKAKVTKVQKLTMLEKVIDKRKQLETLDEFNEVFNPENSRKRIKYSLDNSCTKLPPKKLKALEIQFSDDIDFDPRKKFLELPEEVILSAVRNRDKKEVAEDNIPEINPKLLSSYISLQRDPTNFGDDEFDDTNEELQKQLNNNIEFKDWDYKDVVGKEKTIYKTSNRILEYTKKISDFKMPSSPPIHEYIKSFIEDGLLHADELELFVLLSSYSDCLNVDPFEKENESYLKVYCLHLLNHIFWSQLEDINEEKSGGYSRPRILVILPYKLDALNFATCINEIMTGIKGSKRLNFDRFEEFYDNNDVRQY